MLIKGKKISICGEDKLYFPEGCWISCDNLPVLTLTIKVTSSPATGNGYRAGETVIYKATLTNISEIMANKIQVSDSFGTKFTSGILRKDESQTFLFSHVVTTEDVNNGVLNISVYYDGTLGDSKQVWTYGQPLLHIYRNNVNGTRDNPVKVGDTAIITAYTENTGEVVLHDVTLTNNRNTQSFNVGTLSVGESSETVTFNYVIPNDKSLVEKSQTGDLIIRFTVRVSGDTPTGTGTASISSGVIYLDYGTDSLRIVDYRQNPSSGTDVTPGTIVTYGSAFENNGTEPLDVTVYDNLQSWQYHVGVLQPGETTERFERSYTVPDDAQPGKIQLAFGAVGSSLTIGPGVRVFNISSINVVWLQ